MLDSRFVATIIGLCVAVLAIFSLSGQKAAVHEGFGFGGLPSMTYKVNRVAAASKEAAAKGDFFSVPGTYQSMLSPRFSNLDYGANIQYNMPSYNNQAVPLDPITYGSMALNNWSDPSKAIPASQGGGSGQPSWAPARGLAGANLPSISNETYQKPQTKEDYCGSCTGSVAACGKGGASLPPYTGGAPLTPAGYADGNFNEMRDAAYKGQNGQPAPVQAMMPVQDMTAVNALGETIQPIVYDRFIYANRNSQLRSQGDPIRGDLPIVPCQSDWFRPSVNPNIDLQEGAMNVMGGVGNETANSLAELIYKTSGNSQNAIGGVNMSTTYLGGTSAGQNDIQITAYP